jgi:hypothetical protein
MGHIFLVVHRSRLVIPVFGAIRDWNTRIIVFGIDGRQARAVAEELVKSPFPNVSYFGGTFDELHTGIASK